MSEDDPTKADVENELDMARQALIDANRGHGAGQSNAAVVNRLYYACFHAAQAVLYHRGVNPRSHGGVRSLFGSEVVVSGDATAEQGRFLNELSQERHRADYGSEPVNKDIVELIERSESFVQHMTDLVES
ncbi:MAG: HEPN domain-containing protein [Euryarchaeota archaeon]|nr:HEPN domain-containing protein [Euryarchaeota archaeon]